MSRFSLAMLAEEAIRRGGNSISANTVANNAQVPDFARHCAGSLESAIAYPGIWGGMMCADAWSDLVYIEIIILFVKAVNFG
jgi:hypothetical protein